MTLILKNLVKLFDPSVDDLDAQLWIQKIILKKYLNKNHNKIETTPQRDFK
jgi:hypothetical protein